MGSSPYQTDWSLAGRSCPLIWNIPGTIWIFEEQEKFNKKQNAFCEPQIIYFYSQFIYFSRNDWLDLFTLKQPLFMVVYNASCFLIQLFALQAPEDSWIPPRSMLVSIAIRSPSFSLCCISHSLTPPPDWTECRCSEAVSSTKGQQAPEVEMERAWVLGTDGRLWTELILHLRGWCLKVELVLVKVCIKCGLREPERRHPVLPKRADEAPGNTLLP